MSITALLLSLLATATVVAQPAVGEPALAAGAVGAQVAAPEGGEKVLVRQLAPSVHVAVGPEGTERTLYYFSPTANLGQGDELEQGGAAHCTVALPDGGLVELWASAHLAFDRLDAAGDVLRLPNVTRGRFEAPSRPLVVVLPGGVRAELQGTQIEVRLEPGMLRVRNQGEAPVRLVGFLSVDRAPPAPDGEGLLLLERGQEAELPLFRDTPPLPGRLEDRWSELSLRHDGGFQLEPGSESLVLRPGPDGGPVRDDISVGGVHTSLADARVLLVRSHRPPVLTPLHDLPAEPVGATPAEKTGSKIMTVDTYLQALEAGFTLDDVRLRGFVVPRSVLDEAERILQERDAAPAEDPGETNQEQDG